MTIADLAKLIGGDPSAIAESLDQFRASAATLSSNAPRMIEYYPKQWVALYERSVRARASTLQSVLNELNKEGIPANEAIVRYIDDTHRTRIL